MLMKLKLIDLNVDEIEINSVITNDLSNKKNIKKRPTAM